LRNDLFPKFVVSNAAQREAAMTACQMRASAHLRRASCVKALKTAIVVPRQLMRR
jgi:hypothetical protein